MYLLIIAAGLFAEAFVRDRLVVPNDAAATATNLSAHESLFRFGIAADLSTYVLAIALTVILYALLRPVNRHVALVMLAFNLVQDAIGGLNALQPFRALQLFKSGQPALALDALETHAVGFGVALIFFGCSCIALGYLLFKSGFFPKALGVLIAIAGACYLINSGALLLSPRLEGLLFPAVLIPSFLGELALALWLTVMGLNVQKWEASC